MSRTCFPEDKLKEDFHDFQFASLICIFDVHTAI